ncbi:MAG: VOC family protein [Flammeovirgaceae bacterium]
MRKDATITGTRYVLAVKDLEKSANYYQEKLGFTTSWAGEGWHFLNRGKFMVMLGECPDDRSAFETRNHSYFAYIEVENVDVLFEEFTKKGVEVRKQPTDEPWGQREFAIQTIDGHRIMFGQAMGS